MDLPREYAYGTVFVGGSPLTLKPITRVNPLTCIYIYIYKYIYIYIYIANVHARDSHGGVEKRLNEG